MFRIIGGATANLRAGPVVLTLVLILVILSVILDTLKEVQSVPSVKTAISLEKTLFEQIDDLAKEMQVSRSRLFGLAAREFLARHENQKLLEAINHAYADMPTAEEDELFARMRKRHAEVVKDQW